jgi:hypothetical protein
MDENEDQPMTAEEWAEQLKFEAEAKREYEEALNSVELLSIHEAGHAAVAGHLKLEIIRVLLVGVNSSFTEVKKRPLTKDVLHDELVTLLAGHYAVLKETGKLNIANIHAGIDFARIDEMFATLSISKADQAVWNKEANRVSEQLIDQYWIKIKKIAGELFEHKQMVGGRVREILSEPASDERRT